MSKIRQQTAQICQILKNQGISSRKINELSFILKEFEKCKILEVIKILVWLSDFGHFDDFLDFAFFEFLQNEGQFIDFSG